MRSRSLPSITTGNRPVRGGQPRGLPASAAIPASENDQSPAGGLFHFQSCGSVTSLDAIPGSEICGLAWRTEVMGGNSALVGRMTPAAVLFPGRVGGTTLSQRSGGC